MPDRYSTPSQGTTNWHIPLNDNFSTLDVDVEHRGSTDPDSAGITPADGAKYLNTSTGEIYLADGNSWSVEWNLGNIGSGGGSGGSGVSPEGVEGIETTYDHVGPHRFGDNDSHSTNGTGVAFWAEAGLSINSVVVEADLSSVTTTTMTIELAHYEGGAMNPSTVGTIDVEVSGGPERIDTSGLPPIPSDGEYVLARVQSPNGDVVPCRRASADLFGQSSYDEYTYPQIDFLRGTNIREDGDYGAEGYWYYFYDWMIGEPETRVTSPWSRDVDEIYMRPRDPEEEFDNISPRALWLNTSQ